MSNRLFQGVVHQMRDAIDRVIGVIDESATIISCSELSKIGETNEFVSFELNDSHDFFVRDGYTYKPFGSRLKPEYAVFVEGTDDAAVKYASVLAISLQVSNSTMTRSTTEIILSKTSYWTTFCQVIFTSRHGSCTLTRTPAVWCC